MLLVIENFCDFLVGERMVELGEKESSGIQISKVMTP